MGVLQSEIYHRSLTVPLSTRLVFMSAPTSHSQPPGPLAAAVENDAFKVLHTWLEEQSQLLATTVLPTGHKEADNAREANIKRIDYQQHRLDQILKWSHDHAKVIAKVPGYYTLPEATESILIPPRMYEAFVACYG